MTEQATNIQGDSEPATVTLSAGSQAMTFSTVDPTTGQPLDARAQWQQRLQNKQYVADVGTPGTPAYADRERLVIALAEQDARERGEVLTPNEPSEADLTPGHLYHFPYSDNAPQTPEQQQFDTAARGWLAHAGLDANEGTKFAEEVNKLASRDWTEESLDAHIEAGRAALRGVWGESYASNVALLDRFLGDIEAKAPGLNDFLHDAPFVLTQPLIANRLLFLARQRYGV